MNFGLELLGIYVLIALGGLLVWCLCHLIGAWATQRRALEKGKAAGWLFAFADSARSRGICRLSDYRDAPQKQPPAVQQEQWQPRFTFVSRTYAFAMRPEWELPVHVGNWEGYNLFISILLENITGVKYGKLWKSTRQKLEYMLFHEARDLFVPFATELNGFGNKEQYEFFNPDGWSKVACESYLTYGTTCFEQGR